jgi:uncharacterized coiled-coil protein SlyX
LTNHKLIGDLQIARDDIAQLINFQLKTGKKVFGISPRFDGDDKTGVMRNIQIKSFNIVIDPAQGKETLLSAQKSNFIFKLKEGENMESQELQDKIKILETSLTESKTKIEEQDAKIAEQNIEITTLQTKLQNIGNSPESYDIVIANAQTVIDDIKKLIDPLTEVTAENLGKIKEILKIAQDKIWELKKEKKIEVDEKTLEQKIDDRIKEHELQKEQKINEELSKKVDEKTLGQKIDDRIKNIELVARRREIKIDTEENKNLSAVQKLRIGVSKMYEREDK